MTDDTPYYCGCGYHGTKAEVEAHRAGSVAPECAAYAFADKRPAKSGSDVIVFSSPVDKGRSI